MGVGAAARASWSIEAGDGLSLVDVNGNRVLYPGVHRLVVTRGHGQVVQYEVHVEIAKPIVIDTLF